MDVLQRIKELYKVFDVITYKDVYSTLEEPPKTGNSRNSQWTEFERYCRLEKVSRTKRQIMEIYDTPKEKIDNRGKSESSLKALEENRGHRPPLYDSVLLNKSVSFIHIQEVANRHNMTIEQLIKSNIPFNDKYLLEITPQDLFTQIGLCNDYSRQILLNKDKFAFHGKSPFVEQTYYNVEKDKYYNNVIQWTVGNIYNSMKNKVLKCEYVSYAKIIVDDENCSHRATGEEIKTIKEVEDECIKTFNSIQNTTLEKFGDIYNDYSLTSRQKSLLKQMRKNRLEDKIDNYQNHMSCFFIEKSILSDIEELGIQDMTNEEILKIGEQLKKEVHDIFYNNEIKRIMQKHEEQLNKIHYKRHYGNVKTSKAKYWEHHAEQCFKLLEYVLKLDLTSKDIQEIISVLN